ncbi:MAG: hypothetical protein HYT76_03905 [Deltaproteobacteria bacterium]|nr:hypothetical protein [Deltaproteobacteria bacterium]
MSRGKAVTLLDAGNTLETSIQEFLNSNQKRPFEEWNWDTLKAFQAKSSISQKGFEKKLVYGSDFPYRDHEKYCPRDEVGVQTHVSFAQGGFSNVWGANMLPYCSNDIDDKWPIKSKEMAPHYESVLQFVPTTGEHDHLESQFPLHTTQAQAFRRSRQGEHLHRQLSSKRDELLKKGFIFGSSRLAVDLNKKRGLPCEFCGMCLYGCPNELIYTSRHSLQDLLQDKRLTYTPGVIVERVSESENSVLIEAHSTQGEKLEFKGERLFLAAGPISTTKILLKSMNAYGRTFKMLDSQYFLFPFISLKGQKDVEQERLHTLSQIFMEVVNKEICSRTVHLQFYSYNNAYPKAFQSMLGRFYSLFEKPIRRFMGRVYLVQGYLHSDFSSTIDVSLEKGDEGLDQLSLKKNVNEEVKITIRRISKFLLRQWKLLGGVPVIPKTQIFAPGASNHIGGTFPMREKPQRTFETDRLGRLKGYSRVHAVDSSIFPSIPGTTMTLTTMANAYRIGMESPN